MSDSFISSKVSIFCEKYGVSREVAYRIANGMGSGVRSGEVCGAVLGALLVIGLKYGQHAPDDFETKGYCNAKAEEFLDTFRRENGSIICRALLGCDISTQEGLSYAAEHDLYRTVCMEKVKGAVALLEKLGY
jgi:C_GCAxxG_C_C family probable redox protein